MKPIRVPELAPEQLAELEKLYRTTRNVRLRTRAQMVLLAAERHLTAAQIAEIVRASEETVRRWLKRYLAEGVEGLRDEPQPGAPRRVTEEYLKRMIHAVRRRPRSLGMAFSLWTLQRLADYVGAYPPVLLVGTSSGAHPEKRRGPARRRVTPKLPEAAFGDGQAQRGGRRVARGRLAVLKVTKSYWKGLFRCYRFPDLPRTNNDLEHCLGSARYHERRASGRRNASPAMVVRGSVRVVAALATPPEGLTATDIRPADVGP